MGLAGRSTAVAASWRPRAVRIPPEAVAAALVATAAVLGYELPQHHLKLGAPTPPFYAFPHRRVTLWSPVAALGTIGLAAAAPALMRAPRAWWMAGATLTALASRIVLNVGRFGPDELVRPLVGRIGSHDYLPTVPLFLANPVGYLDSFAERIVAGLPIHPSAHPPGATVLLAALDRAGAPGPWPAAVVILLAGAASTPLVYLLGRALAGEREARVATLAWAFTPTVLIESGTSMDAVFATAGAGAALLIVRGRARSAAAAAVGCSFLSWALPAAAVWAGIVVWLRRGPRDALSLAAAAVLTAVGAYLVLWLATGFDPVAAYTNTKHHYEHGVSRFRPYWYWLLGDPAAFLAGLGVPVAVAYARALGARTAPALALAAVIVAAAASGFAKGEVERIWQFLVPFAVVAAATELDRMRLRPVLVALAVQAVAVEVLFGTTW
jgi:methylthioxylose transferase